MLLFSQPCHARSHLPRSGHDGAQGLLGIVVPGGGADGVAPAASYACATPSWPEKFVAFVRPGMGGELVLQMPPFCVWTGRWPPGSFCAKSGLECSFAEGIWRADLEPHPLTLWPESYPLDPGASAMRVGAPRAGSAELSGARGAVAGPGRVSRAPRICLCCCASAVVSAPSLQMLCPRRDRSQRRHRYLRTHPQGCCIRLSRLPLRRTKAGSTVRKKPDLT